MSLSEKNTEKMSLNTGSERQQKFYKYHGCGNDFIIIDNQSKSSDIQYKASDIQHKASDIQHKASDSNGLDWLSEQKIKDLCTWHTGIGADGLIVLMPSTHHSFRMDYYNADGRMGSLCGNGSRCAVQCAFDLGMRPDETGLFRFEAHDGIHTASIEGGRISVSLLNFSAPEPTLHGWFVNNGSPHFLIHSSHIEGIDVASDGALWRHHPHFNPGGTNVNFVEVTQQDQLNIRTFERGVERETRACGTGVTAAAAWYASVYNKQNSYAAPQRIMVETLGGELQVELTVDGSTIKEVQLIGPASFVFEGHINI